jgi:hypothetical protein
VVERPLSDGAASATAGSQRDDACGSQWPNVRPSQRPSRKRNEYWTYLKGPMPSEAMPCADEGEGSGLRGPAHGPSSTASGSSPCRAEAASSEVLNPAVHPAGCCNAAAPTQQRGSTDPTTRQHRSNNAALRGGGRSEATPKQNAKALLSCGLGTSSRINLCVRCTRNGLETAQYEQSGMRCSRTNDTDSSAFR